MPGALQHIDTAEMYKNEEDIGKGLQEVFSKGSVKREDLFVTSKLWTEHHPKDQVRVGLTGSLKRLQLEYLDLYLIHWCATHLSVTLSVTLSVGLPLLMGDLTLLEGLMLGVQCTVLEAILAKQACPSHHSSVRTLLSV